MSSWSLLCLAAAFEIGFAVALKLSRGLTSPLPGALAVLCMVVSLGLLALAMRQLPAGVSYAVWTGLGTVGTALIGILWLGESAGIVKLASLLLIALGAVGLKLAG